MVGGPRPALAVAFALGTVAPAAPALGADEEKKDDGMVVRGRFGEGVTFESEDGAFGLNLGARAQIRTTATFSDDDEEDPAAEVVVRRLRVTLGGHALHELVSFKLQLAFAPADGDTVAPSPVRDAYVDFSFLRDLELRVGQQKVPFGRQRIVSSGAQQLVDRSAITGELNLDRDVGFVAFSDDLGGLRKWLGYRLGLFGGDGRNRLPGDPGELGLLYVARVEVRPAGAGVGTESESDLSRSPVPRVTIGVSAAANQDSDRQRSTIGGLFAHGPWADYRHGGADVAFQWRGLSVTGEGFLRDAAEETRTDEVEGEVVTDVARSGFGGFLQIGQMLGEHVEIAARAGGLVPTGDPASELEALREIGGGVNAFVVGHALKVQLDVFRLDGDAPDDGSVQARLQLQIAP